LKELLQDPAARMTTFSPAPLSDADYDALEDALLSTDKGRRFLRAYIERNRGTETLRLLRSISRMHRAALGVPGVNAEVCRDLTSILKIVAHGRENAAHCADGENKAESLMSGLEEIEACVITLIESIEEKMAGPLQEAEPGAQFEPINGHSPERTAKLFGELSSYFTTETR
jgi:hypothetical protein